MATTTIGQTEQIDRLVVYASALTNKVNDQSQTIATYRQQIDQNGEKLAAATKELEVQEGKIRKLEQQSKEFQSQATTARVVSAALVGASMGAGAGLALGATGVPLAACAAGGAVVGGGAAVVFKK